MPEAGQAAPHRRRGRRRRTSPLKRRLRYLRHHRGTRWAITGLGGLILLGAAWIVVTGLLARSQLQDVQQRLTAVRLLVSQGQVAEARAEARDIPAMTMRAHRLTSGPAWWTAAQVPVLGQPLDVVRTSTDVVEDLGTHTVPALLDVANDVNPTALRARGDTIRVAPLVRAAPELSTTLGSLTRARDRVDALPHTWFGAVDKQRATLQAQVSTIRGYVSAASRVTRILPTMLGNDGRTVRYFIGLQNEAEMRGTGGLPGAFAIARVHDGTITFERFESDSALLPATRDQLIRTGLDFGASYNQLYAAGRPTQQFNDSNASPQFPYAAQIWAAMYQKLYKQRIDAVVAVDPTVLGTFLDVTGPALVPETGTTVTGANVSALTQRDVYTLYPDNAQRKAFLVDVLRAASKKLTSGSGGAYQLAQAASRSSEDQRLLVWSRDPAVQRLIEQTNYAGDLSARSDRPLSALIVNNAAAGKLDYYLGRTLNYVRTGCGPQRDVTVTFTLTNSAPASGLPPYVTDRLDADPPKNARPGDNRSLVDYYATGGATLRSVSIDGHPATAAVSSTLGRSVFRFDLELPRATTTTVELHLSEPAGTGTPQIWRQPGVTPLAVQEFNQSC